HRVIARSEAAKQSRLSPGKDLDCFASLAMTASPFAISLSARTTPRALRVATFHPDASPPPLAAAFPPRSAAQARQRRARVRQIAANRRQAHARSDRGPAPRASPAPIWRALTGAG